MEKELKRVYITQDNDGHNYVIPYELRADFIVTMANYETSDDAQEHFDAVFSQYATGGDINLIELYARI